MKIIEAMKRIKHLQVKCADLREKLAKHGADFDFENPTYGSVDKQNQQIGEWIQSHNDTLREIMQLRVSIQRTNLATPVTIELGGKPVTKSIAEWIHRRGDAKKRSGLVYQEIDLWEGFAKSEVARRLQDGNMQTSAGTVSPVKVRRYYDVKERDEALALLKAEPTIIDGQLEVVNATTDLIEEPAA